MNPWPGSLYFLYSLVDGRPFSVASWRPHSFVPRRAVLCCTQSGVNNVAQIYSSKIEKNIYLAYLAWRVCPDGFEAPDWAR